MSALDSAQASLATAEQKLASVEQTIQHTEAVAQATLHEAEAAVATVQHAKEVVEESTPWHVFSDGFKTLRQYVSIEAMSHDIGVAVTEIEAAIAHAKGTLGGFHFVKR